MRILHTSDWHLGKLLEGYSRLEEQQLFLEELTVLCSEKEIDMILVCGDIYDNYNPSAKAEQAFFTCMEHLSDNGKRPIIVIAGNHDSPERLTASAPICWQKGIFLIGTIKNIVPTGHYDGFSVLDSGEGYFELELKGEKAVILPMPYPSEKRLNEIIGEMESESEDQSSYSEKIGAYFRRAQKKFRPDTVNLAMGHFFVSGGQESSSERPIQLGGALAIDRKDLPLEADYIALGHLHRPQTVSATKKKAFYSGSPLPYSKDEILYSKSVQIVDLRAGEEAQIEKILLRNYKPIECLEATGVEDAYRLLEERTEQNLWIYLTIHLERVLEQQEIKKMKTIKPDIIEIEPIFVSELTSEIRQTDQDKSLKDQFLEFYFNSRKVLPTDETIHVFLQIMNQEDEDEANFIEDYGD